MEEQRKVTKVKEIKGLVKVTKGMIQNQKLGYIGIHKINGI